MPDSQSYQLMYTGEQVDDALGRIISGEINQSAQNSAISSYASRVWAEGEQASYNPVSFGQIEAHGVKVAYDGTEDISIVPGATYKVTSGSDEVSVIAAVNPSATEYGTFTAFGIVFDSNAANYINATNSTDTTITVSTQRQPSGFSGTSSKQYAQQAGQRANSAAQSNTNAGNAAQQAESWAVGGTGTRDGEDTNNAKYWCEQAQEAGQGVSSFNNRTGAVTPQSGDYSADMIADLPFTVLKGTVEAPIDLLAISVASNTYKRYYMQADVSNLQNCFVDYSEIFNRGMSSPFEAMTAWEIILTCIVMNGLFASFLFDDSDGYIMGNFFTYGNINNTWVSASWNVGNGALMPYSTRLYIFPDAEKVAAPSTSFQRTLAATGWTGEEAPYTQEVSSGTNNRNANGYVALPQTATAAQIEAAQKARLRVSAQTFYQFTVTADGEKPTVDIPIQVTLLGDNPDYQ